MRGSPLSCLPPWPVQSVVATQFICEGTSTILTFVASQLNLGPNSLLAALAFYMLLLPVFLPIAQKVRIETLSHANDASSLSSIGVCMAMGGGIWYGRARARMQEFETPPPAGPESQEERLPLVGVDSKGATVPPASAR